LVHKMRREGEHTRVWLHDALDASRPSDHTLNPFSAVNCFLNRIWPVRLSPPYLGLRCVVESEGRESMWVSLIGTRGRSVGHMLFTRGDSWLVGGTPVLSVPAEMSAESCQLAWCWLRGPWNLTFGLQRFWDPGLCYILVNFLFFFKF
jgi:hypothetical protein